MDAPDELEGELPAGERVGRVAVLRDGKVVKRVPLVTAAEVPGAGPLRVISDELGGALIADPSRGLSVAAWWSSGSSREGARGARAERRRERQRARARAES